MTYSQAAANTRVVGAMMAELMKALQSNAQASYATMHLIGHSLGAHIAGYAGEIISGIGRISGNIGAATCDFQQCGIFTSVYSNEPTQPPFRLRNSR